MLKQGQHKNIDKTVRTLVRNCKNISKKWPRMQI